MMELLHNETVAAVAGGIVTAIATYLVVSLTDRRRARRKARKRVPASLTMYRNLLGVRIQGTEKALETVTANQRHRFTGDRLPVETIRRYAEELADHLEPRQAMALYNIAFGMEQADVLTGKAHRQLDEILAIEQDPTRGEASPRLQLVPRMTELQRIYQDQLYLLRRAAQIIDTYLEGKLNPRGGLPGDAP